MFHATMSAPILYDSVENFTETYDVCSDFTLFLDGYSTAPITALDPTPIADMHQITQHWEALHCQMHYSMLFCFNSTSVKLESACCAYVLALGTLPACIFTASEFRHAMSYFIGVLLLLCHICNGVPSIINQRFTALTPPSLTT